MASQSQIHANRTNAQKSTGPKSIGGKARSSANAAKHGLQANPTTIFENNPHERSQYDALKAKLLNQLLPEGELELQAFERHVFATFQAERARTHELDAQQRWLDEPSNNIWFIQMERIQKLGALQERRAAKALNELRQLQRDRLSALDVANELYLLGQRIPIPASLPVSEMRRTKQTQTSPIDIALQLIANSPDTRAILSGDRQQQPNEPVHLTEAGLQDLDRAARRETSPVTR